MDMYLSNYGRTLTLSRRRLRVDRWDNQVARFLRNLAAYFRDCADASRPQADLLEARDEFRQIIATRPLAGLALALHQGDGVTKRLAIWLLGKCDARLATSLIVDYRENPDPKVRRAVARALRRLGAWSDLKWFELNDPDTSIQRLATVLAQRPRAFSDRLRQFAGPPSQVAESQDRFESRMPLVWDANHFDGKPPKPAWLIRRILERIRQAVTDFTR